MTFAEFFEQATGNSPFDYQLNLAEGDWPDLLEAPTGAGKTEAVVLGWLWRRRFASAVTRATTPRRLAYCLPMRVLVEQVEKRVSCWLEKLGLASQIGVHILMGGEVDGDWDVSPERETVLIGTQDMLLSRAMNRGYGLSRARWPIPYGLLNNDCLWVLDEVQLMGSGLATTAQFAAFRERFGVWGNCPTLWASATLRPEWLSTVDFRGRVSHLRLHTLSKGEWTSGDLHKRLNAKKVLAKADYSADDPKKLAKETLGKHQPGTLTLVVVNTVNKAVAIYSELQAKPSKRDKKSEPPQPDVVLLHSRFRPQDRRQKVERVLDETLPTEGRIVVSTQVVEAGVDISARTLFTELSPWPSFVQRVGRCNRKGEYKQADVYWIDVNVGDKKGAAKNALPYTPGEVEAARKELIQLKDAGPRALHDYLAGLPQKRQVDLYPYEPEHVIRQRTVEELFDTTPDLTDADLDVSLYVRENDDHDVYLFWRAWEGNDPNQPQPQSAPNRDELCPATLNKETKDWLDKHRQYRWGWDFLEGRWQRAESIVPGHIYLLPADAGGYSADRGFDPSSSDQVVQQIVTGQAAEGNDSDPYSTERRLWQTIAAHTNQVVEELENILKELGPLLTREEAQYLCHAARWHDWGKAYDIFQRALVAKTAPDFPLPDGLHRWAKSNGKSERYEHPGFRHELASALGMVTLGHPDLACYLAAAHHGKVRLSIRSLPSEKPAPEGRRFARGVWEGDSMPPVKLGGGVVAPEMTFSLAPMELGLSQNGRPSWAERVLGLCKTYGPFRLAYLEALLCAADRRASGNARPGVSND